MFCPFILPITVEFFELKCKQITLLRGLFIYNFVCHLYCSFFFLTQEALAKNSARKIRLAFLLHSWNATLDYGENVLREAEQTEKMYNVRNFILLDHLDSMCILIGQKKCVFVAP